jgi:predicted DNA-binding transcriptional regulator YafY
MPPLVLSNDEALAVVLGLLAAERLGMGTAAPASAGALAKIEWVLPHSLREPLAAMRETLSFTANAVIGQAPGTGVLLALAQVSRARTTVGISHQSWRQEHTERDIDPTAWSFTPAAGTSSDTTTSAARPTGTARLDCPHRQEVNV